jgi:hypothetical protein
MEPRDRLRSDCRWSGVHFQGLRLTAIHANVTPLFGVVAYNGLEETSHSGVSLRRSP